MERLTKRITENQIELSAKANTPQHYSPIIHTKHPFWTAFDKLAEYEQEEEDGLLIRVKLKVGDIVYDNCFGMPCGYKITGISFGTAEDYIDEPIVENEVVYYYQNSSGSISGSFASSEIGKSVFLTLSEAEQALAKMKGE